MLIFVLILLLPVVDSGASLYHSYLFDEENFRSTRKFTTNCCIHGCKVYATIEISEENTNITQNILVNDPNTKKNYSVADLSALFLPNTDNQKGYVEIGRNDQLTCYNTNANQESAPLALWIVSAKSPYYHDAEVYEPLNFSRRKAWANYPITILSAYPFTLNVQPGNNAILAKPAGFDAIDRNSIDDCFTALDTNFSESIDGLTLSINGPLLTLLFTTKDRPNSFVEITGNTTFDFDRFPSPKQPDFISSPGFVCGGPTFYGVFESSALKASQDYTIKTPNNTKMKLSFDIDVDSDFMHPVTIFDPVSQSGERFYGNFDDKTNIAQMSMETNSATVSFTPGPCCEPGSYIYHYSFFGMRVRMDEIEKSTTEWTTEKNEAESSTTKTSTTSAIEITTSSAGHCHVVERVVGLMVVIALLFV